MGFGILLIGYFLAFATSLAGVYFYADIIGGILMVYALNKLSSYSSKFKAAAYTAVAFTAISMVAAVLTTLKIGGTAILVVNTIRAASILIFHIYTFNALEVMAKGADDPKLASKAKRDLVFVSGYYILYIVITLTAGIMDDTLKAYFSVMMYMYGILCVILNLILLHSAYCRLYIEGTQQRYAEFAEYKPSKIKFIDNIRRKYYDSQKKAYEENYKLISETRDAAREAYKNKAKTKGKKKR